MEATNSKTDNDNNIAENKKENQTNFIKEILNEHLKSNKYNGKVHTRFPPEPNGYLHIGHAKSICLNFGIAKEYSGLCNLRFDDTNPSKEEVEYVESIQEDVHWLGFSWEDRMFFASDYFDKLFEYAIELIKKGKAYVCDLAASQIKDYRGTLTEPGKESPFRNRSVDENLDLFHRMSLGEFDEGSRVLRAKIDMASPNLNMRDPVIYRILKVDHHRTGNKWCIYPMYDFAHGLSDSIEGITHSICTLEFEAHRPLYDWFIDQLEVYHPQQIEFARLNLSYTIMSKRKLLQLVQQGIVNGWDDPRMPTISGLRRRGYTPESIRNFCDRIGVAKRDNLIDVALLEHSIREDLNKRALRVMAVLRPLKVIIDNYPVDMVEEINAVNNPEDLEMGKRKVLFTKVIYIEQDDFHENPPKKYFRLSPGNEVRLRYSYIIKCTNVIKNEVTGEIKELHCTYDPESLGESYVNKKAKGTIHWVSEKYGVKAQVRLYDRLFTSENSGGETGESDFKSFINPNSLEIINSCLVEPSLVDKKAGTNFQFERLGYFYLDPVDSKNGLMVFNRTVQLRDTWAKIQKLEK